MPEEKMSSLASQVKFLIKLDDVENGIGNAVRTAEPVAQRRHFLWQTYKVRRLSHDAHISLVRLKNISEFLHDLDSKVKQSKMGGLENYIALVEIIKEVKQTYSHKSVKTQRSKIALKIIERDLKGLPNSDDFFEKNTLTLKCDFTTELKKYLHQHFQDINRFRGGKIIFDYGESLKKHFHTNVSGWNLHTDEGLEFFFKSPETMQLFVSQFVTGSYEYLLFDVFLPYIHSKDKSMKKMSQGDQVVFDTFKALVAEEEILAKNAKPGEHVLTTGTIIQHREEYD